MARAADIHLLVPGGPVDLSAIDPADTSAAPGGGDKAATQEAIWAQATRLAELQDRLWAGAEHRLLVVLQGMDTAGKGGTVKRVLGAVNPAGLQVTSFRKPTETELARDYLWRIHAAVPTPGQIAVFDRSHYEDVIAVRVDELVPEERWRRRYDHINAFERMLVDEGTTMVKLLLHISRDEQRARLESRRDERHKQWKLNRGDLAARAKWDDYQHAFEEMLERTSTQHAPWHVVPADKKWYRDWAVATILIETLESLDLAWPEPEEDVADLDIR